MSSLREIIIQKVSLFLKASKRKKVSYVLRVGFSDLLVGLVGPESPLDHRLLSLPWSLHGLFYPNLQQGLAFLYFPVGLAHRHLLPGKQTNTNTPINKQVHFYTVYIFLNDISTERLERNTTWNSNNTLMWQSVASFQNQLC